MRGATGSPEPYALDADNVVLAAQLACLLEISAAKPGNVTRFADFADARYDDYLASAAILGMVFRRAATATTGSLVLEVVRETHRLVGLNTNLGIALLFAPLAKAALLGGRRSLRSGLHTLLASLTPTDGRRVYEAIRLAQPGGLGEVNQFDVRSTRGRVPLLAAMRTAMEWDSIAREYVSDFELTCTIGAPALKKCLKKSHDPEASIIQTYLTLLSRVPDSLIARKCGLEQARAVTTQAGRVLAVGGAFTREGRQSLRRWDRALRTRGNRLNPGTTADLTAAAIYAVMLEEGIEFMLRRGKGIPGRER